MRVQTKLDHHDRDRLGTVTGPAGPHAMTPSPHSVPALAAGFHSVAAAGAGVRPVRKGGGVQVAHTRQAHFTNVWFRAHLTKADEAFNAAAVQHRAASGTLGQIT